MLLLIKFSQIYQIVSRKRIYLGFYFKTTLSIIMKNGKLTINGNLSIQFINNNKLQLNDNVNVTFPKNNLRIYSKNYNDRHDDN